MSNGGGAFIALWASGAYGGGKPFRFGGGGGGGDGKTLTIIMVVTFILMVAPLVALLVHNHYVLSTYEFRAKCAIGEQATFITDWRKGAIPHAPAPGKYDAWDGCIAVGYEKHWLKPGEVCVSHRRKIGDIAFEQVNSWAYKEDFDAGQVCGERR